MFEAALISCVFLIIYFVMGARKLKRIHRALERQWGDDEVDMFLARAYYGGDTADQVGAYVATTLGNRLKLGDVIYVDRALERAEPKLMTTDFVLALLNHTAAFKHFLPSRKDYYGRAKTVLRSREGWYKTSRLLSASA